MCSKFNFPKLENINILFICLKRRRSRTDRQSPSHPFGIGHTHQRPLAEQRHNDRSQQMFEWQRGGGARRR